MDAVGRCIAIFLAVILVILFPLQYIAQSQSETLEGAVSTYATEFTDTARHQGYISLEGYEEFVGKLDLTGEIYDVTLEAAHPVTGKEMAKLTLGDEIPDLKADTTSYMAEDSYTSSVAAPSSSDGEIYSMAGHTHTANCYAACKGIDYNGDRLVDQEDLIYNSTTYPGNYTVTTYSCRACGALLYLSTPSGSTTYNHGNDTSHLLCDKVVTGITPVSPVQTLNHGIFNSNVIATYLDGHTETITVSNNFNPYTAGTQTVTLTYIGLAGSAKTIGSLRTSVTANVLAAHTVDCYPNGHLHSASCSHLGNTAKQVIMKMVYSASASDGTTYTLYVYCSECHKLIASFYYDSNNGGYQYFSTTYFVYATDGTITTKTYLIFARTYEDQIRISTVLNSLINYFNSIGYTYKINNSFPDGLYQVKVGYNTAWSYGDIPYITSAGIINYAPWTGCLYCVEEVAAYSCGLTEVLPLCSQVVMNIAATNPVQTVNKGGSIITTATATYLDGHTATVNCTSNFNPNLVGTQTVTLTYSGLVGNAKTTGTRTCTISVTVVDQNAPSSLSVVPSATTVYNGTQPAYTVTLTYDNNTTKVLTSAQYTKTGWSTGPGVNTVVFSYTENGKTVTASVKITVKPNLSSISAAPATAYMERYTEVSLAVTARYEDGTSKPVTGWNISGLNKANLGSQLVTITYTENNITKTTTATVIVTNVTKICPICGTRYEMDAQDRDSGCPVCNSKIISIIASPISVTVSKGEVLPITVQAVYLAGTRSVVTGWTSNYAANVLGLQEVTITYQGMQTTIMADVRDNRKTCPICSKSYPINEDGTDPGCPSCTTEVISITASPKQVTIERHQPLNLTVMATFRDGHIGLVTGWSTNLAADTAGTFDISVFYKSATDHITVIVLGEGRMHCIYCGLDYSFYDYPEGCPLCYKTVVGIEASLRNGGTTVPYKSDLNLQIVLIYKDTHRVLAYTGWTVSGYRPDLLGMQTVTVFCNGFSTTLTIEVVNALPENICPNGHEYYLNADGSDPGCPFCILDTIKDNAVFFFDNTYTSDIVEILYADGIYYLQHGDYLTITVTQRSTSLRSTLQKMFFGSVRGMKEKTYTFGGEVI